MTDIPTYGAVNEYELDSQSGKNDEDDSFDDDIENLIEALGECKWFDVSKGYGFITPETNNGEEQRDVFVYKSTIQMAGEPSLKQGEKVRFWYKPSGERLKAVKVCGPTGEDCVGCPKKPHRRKGRERSYCYNCGEGGHHAKECNYPPLPKRCHHCKSVDHLVAQCPLATSGPSSGRNRSSSSNSNSSESGKERQLMDS